VPVVVLEAHVQRVFGGRLDRHHQAVSSDLALRRHFVAHFLQRREQHAVDDFQLAVTQAAAEAARFALIDGALVQVRNEHLGRVRAQHQAAPQLFAGDGVHERVERVVNFNQVFEFHVAVLVMVGRGVRR